MGEAAMWDELPAEEHQFVWDEAEEHFWQDFNRTQDAQHAESEQSYQRALREIRYEIGTLDGKRAELNRTRDRLAHELRNVEEELSRVVSECDDKADTMTALEQHYRRGEQQRLEKRSKVSRTMVKWFRRQRGEQVPGDEDEDEDDVEVDIEVEPSNVDSRRDEQDGASPMEDVQYNAEPTPAVKPPPPPPTTKTPIVPVAPPAKTASAQLMGDALVDIVDAEGRVIGPVQRIEPWNQWVKAIQEMPITRPVKIRRGRKFTQDHLATIYERTEAKGVKWLSCMIQAIGEVQGQRCLSCDKNQGAFDDCIVVGGPLFQKCGNCEWNRQGCHGAALRKANAPEPEPEPVAPAETRPEINGAAQPVETRQIHRMHLAHLIHHIDQEAQEAAELKARRQLVAQEALAKAAGLASDAIIRSVSAPPQPVLPKETIETPLNGQPPSISPEQPPTPTGRDPKPYIIRSGFTPANAASRPPSRDLLTPTEPSEASPQPADRDESQEDLPEITRETIVLKHNDKEYVYPEIVEGVPVEKIDQDHPYWDPKWPDIKTLIGPSLSHWQEKYQAALEAKERGEKGSARFQLGRQVNRGLKILEFLEAGDISPYQLLSKKYTHSGKGSITSYDTLFRLCETLSELAKYGLDMPPVDWMRQRLHELWLEQGPAFNVSKIIHNFYNDPKLSALRAKAGYKNIGRPSGCKTTRASLGATPSGTPEVQAKKLKITHSSSTEMPMDYERLFEI